MLMETTCFCIMPVDTALAAGDNVLAVHDACMVLKVGSWILGGL
jgi:hypothetical protein